MIDVEYGLLTIPELIIARCVKHPHIVSASKVIREKNSINIIYNTNGIFLKTLIERDELSIVQKLKIIYEIGTAIAMLHNKGYSHGNINVNSIIGEYDKLYYCPKLITNASLGSPEKLILDFEDYKTLILELLCPNIEKSFKLSKEDLSVILPYIPKSLRDFIIRVCNHTQIFEILSSPEFDKYNKTGIITRFQWATEIKRLNVNELAPTINYYREGLKMIYNIFRDYISDHYVDEMFAAIDIYNRSFSLVTNQADLQSYYCACILIASKIFNNTTFLTIDDIRDAIHSLLKSHPKREDVLSWELDIVVFLNGIVYSPGLFEECKNIKELYALFTFYILESDRYSGYHEFIERLKKLHSESHQMRTDTYVTCGQLFQLEFDILEDEMENLENYLE